MQTARAVLIYNCVGPAFYQPASFISVSYDMLAIALLVLAFKSMPQTSARLT